MFHKQDHLGRGPKEHCSSCRVGESSFNLSKVFVAQDNIPQNYRSRDKRHCTTAKVAEVSQDKTSCWSLSQIAPKRSQETSIKDGSVHLSFAVRMGMGGGDQTWEALEAPSIHNTIMFEVIV